MLKYLYLATIIACFSSLISANEKLTDATNQADDRHENKSAGKAEDNDAHLVKILELLKKTNKYKYENLTLEKLAEIEELELREYQMHFHGPNPDFPSVKDEHLNLLSNLKALKKLTIEDCSGITADGYKYLSNIKNLKELNLSRFNITDLHIKHISKISSLNSLNLFVGFLVKANLSDLAKLNSLKYLSLNFAYDNSADLKLKEIANIKSLESLKLIAVNKKMSLKPFSEMTHLKALDLSGNALTDDNLKHLSVLTNLRVLNLDCYQNEFTNDGLRHLSSLKKLEDLNLKWTLFQKILNETGTIHLAKLINLKRLNLCATGLTDNALGQLTSLKNLEDLDLTETEITDNGLKYLKGMTKMKKLNLMHVQITGDGLKYLAPMRSLNELNLSCTTRSQIKLDADSLRHLSELKSLKTLDLGGNLLTSGLKHLQKLENLKTLGLRYNKISDDSIRFLLSLESLESLDLQFNNLTDLSINDLVQMKSLKQLKVRSGMSQIPDMFSRKGFRDLRKAMPNCKVF